MPKRKSKAKQAMALLRKNDEITAFIDYIKDPDIKIETLNAIKKLIQDAKDLADKKQPVLEAVKKQINQTSDEKPPVPQKQQATMKPVKIAKTKAELGLFNAARGLLSSAKKHLASIDNANLVYNEFPILAAIASQQKDNRQAKRNALFKDLITQRKDIDVNLATTDRGFTPLYIAAQNGHTGIVELLLSVEGIKVNKANIYDGATPLFVAVQQGHSRIVELLLDAKGIEVNEVAIKNGNTPLCSAAQEGHTDIMRLLLGTPGIKVNQAVTNNDVTPLYIAAQQGHTGIVKLLLDVKGIEVNKANTSDGITPLYIAAQQGHTGIVKLLLGVKDIKVNKKNTSDDSTPLFVAAQNNHSGIIRLLLDAKGINVNQATADNGATPLYVAAEKGHADIVKLFLRTPRTEVNQATTDSGATPLYIAAGRGHTDIVKLLLDASGIDVNQATTDSGDTPLYIAAERGHTNVVELLLDASGIDVNQATTDSGLAPLYIAAEHGHTDIVKLLLDALGIDVNQAMKDSGITPLFIATQRGYIAIVELLLNTGKRLDFEIKHKHDSEEVSHHVLEIAQEWQHYTLIQLLQDHLGITSDEKPGTPAEPITVNPQPRLDQESGRSANTATGQDQANLRLMDKKYEYISNIKRNKHDPWLGFWDRMPFIRQIQQAQTSDSIDRIYRDFLSLIMDKKKQQQPHTDEKGNKSKPSQAPATFHIGKKAYKEEDLVAAVQAELIDPKNRPFAHGACHKLADGKTSPTDYPVIVNGSTLPVRHCSAGVPGVGSCSLFFFLDEKQNRIVIIAIGYHDETIKPVKGQPRFKYRLDWIDDNYFAGRKSAVVGT